MSEQQLYKSHSTLQSDRQGEPIKDWKIKPLLCDDLCQSELVCHQQLSRRVGEKLVEADGNIARVPVQQHDVCIHMKCVCVRLCVYCFTAYLSLWICLIATSSISTEGSMARPKALMFTTR